jgi:hypothetical protein
MYTTQERRAKPRINCDCAAIVEGIDVDGIKYNDEGRLINLSASGLLMLVNRDIESGTKLSITVLFSNSQIDIGAPKLATNGIVVRKEPQTNGTCGVAVKFHNYRFL